MEGDVKLAPVSPCSLKIRLTLSVIGVFVGVSVFCVFSFHYHNYNAGLWGLGSGLSAATALGVTVSYMKQVWDANPRRLKLFMLTGCFIQLAGVCGFVAYLVLAVSQNQGLIVYGPGYYVTCVWCFMTWKWGFALLLYSRSFFHSYTGSDHIIQGKTSYSSLDNGK